MTQLKYFSICVSALSLIRLTVQVEEKTRTTQAGSMSRSGHRGRVFNCSRDFFQIGAELLCIRNPWTALQARDSPRRPTGSQCGRIYIQSRRDESSCHKSRAGSTSSMISIGISNKLRKATMLPLVPAETGTRSHILESVLLSCRPSGHYRCG